MNSILKKFVDEPLFDACAAMLNYLHISFNEVTRTPVPFEGLYRNPLTKALQEILVKVENTYFIGTVDEASLSGRAARQDENDVTAKASEGKYVGMMIFAVDVKPDQTLTRTELATLTRGFNRIAAAQPVVLFIKQGNRLALATCERSEYTQQWRDGEKLGKVSLLRGINCLQPHRGHIDILESIGDKAYPTFEELYKHWMQVFSSELLTRKFYSELSDWYAWAVQVARFPNDLNTTEDDEKFNHESCIRLITRLIFVWFLKQKHLIPEEFFDERYIHDHFIENFNPHDRENLLYNPEKSKYYRLVLQNLFFAMLNRPIVPEGKDTPNNRRFRVKGNYHGMNPDYAVNNLLRYEGDFKEGGAAEFLAMANSNVPFLNGGLFDCLDDKPKNLYYDGFSERRESLEQLYLPDWLFFGEEVGKGIDLSQWYDDAKKKNVSARGIIDILKRYNFTIEENTPLDQEVSLDPELLGKAFENLLASYNPETKTSARKQTGSFYTPREIVQYMVDESLVAHLKRICGDEMEPQYRSLLSYATNDTALNEEQRRSIMQAIYNCRVLDPACGSGAFPMGVLQQMVHILRQLDPTNEMWKDFMIDIAIDQSRKAFNAEEEEERKARLADIEEAFNRDVNDPDYARKLYLIEHCIYGVDIQPIAVQISKLRFFISLVVDQNPTDDAAHNFGIRPLPNLESKFVAANTLIPVEYDASLFESTETILSLKESLKELNHAIFLAKRNIDKQRIKTKIKETRKALAHAIEDTGFVNPGAAQKLADWDMFEQNTHADFFDAEWMFGVKGGFDIVIGNPPYVVVPVGLYPNYEWNNDLYKMFFELSLKKLCLSNGVVTMITPKFYLLNKDDNKMRLYFMNRVELLSLVTCNPFDAVTENVITIIQTEIPQRITVPYYDYNSEDKIFERLEDLDKNYCKTNKYNEMIFGLSTEIIAILQKMYERGKPLGELTESKRGAEVSKNFLRENDCGLETLIGQDMRKYCILWNSTYLPQTHKEYRRLRQFFDSDVIYLRRVDSMLEATISPGMHYGYNKNVYGIKKRVNCNYGLRYLLACMNSKVVDFYYKKKFSTKKTDAFPEIQTYLYEQLPIPTVSDNVQSNIESLVDDILDANKNETSTTEMEQEIDRIVYHLYGLTYDEVLIIDPTPPFTQEEYEQDNL
jgi:hypothetical protein